MTFLSAHEQVGVPFRVTKPICKSCTMNFEHCLWDSWVYTTFAESVVLEILFDFIKSHNCDHKIVTYFDLLCWSTRMCKSKSHCLQEILDDRRDQGANWCSVCFYRTDNSMLLLSMFGFKRLFIKRSKWNGAVTPIRQGYGAHYGIHTIRDRYFINKLEQFGRKSMWFWQSLFKIFLYYVFLQKFILVLIYLKFTALI